MGVSIQQWRIAIGYNSCSSSYSSDSINSKPSTGNSSRLLLNTLVVLGILSFLTFIHITRIGNPLSSTEFTQLSYSAPPPWAVSASEIPSYRVVWQVLVWSVAVLSPCTTMAAEPSLEYTSSSGCKSTLPSLSRSTCSPLHQSLTARSISIPWTTSTTSISRLSSPKSCTADSTTPTDPARLPRTQICKWKKKIVWNQDKSLE